MTQEAWAKRNFKPTQLPHHHYWEKTEITCKNVFGCTRKYEDRYAAMDEQ